MRPAGLVALALAALPACGTFEAARLLRDAVRGPDALAARTVATEEERGGVPTRVFRPRGRTGPLPRVVLVQGASEEGLDDPRLVAFARALAARGFAVSAVALPTLTAYRVDARDPARLARLAAGYGGPVALVGVSVGGTYCVIAAARPEARDRVSCVLSFGGYADLERLLRAWLTGPPPRGVPADAFATARERALAGNRDRIGDAGRGADALLAPLRRDLRALRPRAAPRAPVFVLHGAADPVVPAAHAPRLAARLAELGADVEVHVTDLFAHVDPEFDRSPSYFEARPLLRFVARFLAAARARPRGT